MRFSILKVTVLAGVIQCVVAVRPAAAQIEPRATMAGAYTYLREQGPGNLGVSNYTIGWVATGSRRLGSGRLSGVGEVGTSMRDNFFGEKQRLLGILGGVRVGLAGSARTLLFAQVLLGIERFSEPGFTESGLTIQPGAGLDVRMGSRYFLRLQGDYRSSRQTAGSFNDIRVLAGMGVRLGK